MFVFRSKLDRVLEDNRHLADHVTNLRHNYDRLKEDADELLAKYREVCRHRDDSVAENARLRTRVSELIEEQDACHNWIGNLSNKYKMVTGALARDVGKLHDAWHGAGPGSEWPWEKTDE